jgi:hypothetical protein
MGYGVREGKPMNPLSEKELEAKLIVKIKDNSYFKCCSEAEGKCEGKAILAFRFVDESANEPSGLSDKERHPEGWHYRCVKHNNISSEKTHIINLTKIEDEILEKIRQEKRLKLRQKLDKPSPIKVEVIEK